MQSARTVLSITTSVPSGRKHALEDELPLDAELAPSGDDEEEEEDRTKASFSFNERAIPHKYHQER